MPPIRKKDPLKSTQDEGKIELAISDLKNGRIRSIREAARIYMVARTTLQDRMKGVPYRQITRANNHKLSQSEEDSLVKWVLDLTKRGLPPRHFLVRDMANYLLSQHGDQRVGDKWVYNLVQRRPEIESKFSRKYNYERAKCEDPKIIQGHFDRVRDIISEYGILPEDIYNFDETGFAMGLCATAKVITGSDRYAQPKLLQPGNREWVTAIEATNSTGWALPSYMIFKAKKNVRLGWFDELPDDWRINISDNGWTTDQIGLEWLKTHFIPLTSSRTLGTYSMLILDGHGSHLTAEFDRTCTDHKIIPVSNDALLVWKENRDLRAAHEKEKQKRKRSNKQISIEQGITREEAQVLVQGQVEASQAVTTTPAEPELPTSQAVVRRQFRCSDCNVEGHRINRCPNRTSN
ncbi:conserved hypothetical protein [Talaromyces stipitatus ATCC 10500]|uniref:HTH CENPB-type domain-containing protein n=1 Tax=Talaromyces stipitatus (strain ATCC 10500 / CBS 375.48 / QM 6759 / NRRL 1006) TaxID=441959 RepID=B8MNU5_TALSN|nr:uncharacterized protein TSTA_104030 [Talaromyces stipitatus ATCC 10500]EED14184.1 conserved hypothetical protein [Talaromyces stipitatus ATCC 10500]